MNGRDAGITHFTSRASAISIMDGWRKDLSEGNPRRNPGAESAISGPPEVKLRLYGRWGTNDPWEQRIAKGGMDIVRGKHRPEKTRLVFPDTTFMACGSKPQIGSDGETADRLEMWRAYGDDGHGVALTTWWNQERLREDGLEIIEVAYLSAADFESKLEKLDELHAEQMDESKSRAEREEVRRCRARMAAGCKIRDYEAEQEVRLVCFLGDESSAVSGPGPKELHFASADGRLRTWIERPVRLGVTLTGLDITLGPRMPDGDVQHWTAMGDWMLRQMGLSGGQVRQSKLQYVG